MTKKTSLCIAVLIMLITQLSGQDTQQKKDSIKNISFTAFPILYYLPETGLGYGALGVTTFRFKNEQSTSRPSSLQMAISLTSKKQFLLFAPYEIYWNDEKWRIVGELGYYKYFYNFYGVGVNALEEDMEIYEVNFPRLRMSILREIAPALSVGMGYALDNYTQLKIDSGGILEASDVIGKEGGTVSNLGFVAFYDSRDNIFYPTRGLFLQANAFWSASFLGSSFDYNKVELDARYFRAIGKRSVLGFNLFTGSSSSGVPFMDYYYVGSKRTRGFNDRRFQDKSELSAIMEFRFPIAGRFGAAVFGSTGTVAPDFGALFSSAYKNSGGLGIRYILNRKEGVRIRVDYGISADGGNLYFTINEAF